MAGKQFSDCQIVLTEVDMTLIEVEVTLPDPARLISCAGNNNKTRKFARLYNEKNVKRFSRVKTLKNSLNSVT